MKKSYEENLLDSVSEDPNYVDKVRKYERLTDCIFYHFKKERDPNLNKKKLKTRLVECLILAETLETLASKRPDFRIFDFTAEAYFNASYIALELRDVDRYRKLMESGKNQIFKSIAILGYTGEYSKEYYDERMDHSLLDKRAIQIEKGRYRSYPLNWDWF